MKPVFYLASRLILRSPILHNSTHNNTANSLDSRLKTVETKVTTVETQINDIMENGVGGSMLKGTNVDGYVVGYAYYLIPYSTSLVGYNNPYAYYNEYFTVPHEGYWSSKSDLTQKVWYNVNQQVSSNYATTSNLGGNPQTYSGACNKHSLYFCGTT